MGSDNPNAPTGAIPPAAGTEFRAQRPNIPPAPFFQGFAALRNQMLFLFPHSFMPPVPGVGFATPTQGILSATIDLTEGSQNEAPKNA